MPAFHIRADLTVQADSMADAIDAVWAKVCDDISDIDRAVGPKYLCNIVWDGPDGQTIAGEFQVRDITDDPTEAPDTLRSHL